MSIKDLIVHVNVSEHCHSRLQVAAQLAKAFDAHLTALYTSVASDVPFMMMDALSSQYEPTMRAWSTRIRNKVKADFEELRRSHPLSADWVEIEGDVGALMARQARYADLTILGQNDPNELLPYSEHGILERVMLASGRPVLIVPHGTTITGLGQRVLVAWNGSAQSARAVNDSLPLLKKAERVIILTVTQKGSQDEDGQQGRDIATHLARHQIKAETFDLMADDTYVGDLILSRASDERADLIVMGGYGHLRAGEILFGGVTRTLFERMTVPTLMSH